MDSWDNNEWPMNIRKKDEEQKQFHKSVTSAFFLMLDGNEQALPMDTIRELCRLPETDDAQQDPSKPERAMRDIFDEDYGQMLDVIDGLKSSIAFGEDGNNDLAELLMAEFAETIAPHEDDFDVPLFRLTERRSTKPS